MDKPKIKCAEIYHLNSQLEIICSICSETYKRIYSFCDHLLEKHFDLQNDDFLEHFLDQTKAVDSNFPHKELRDSQDDLNIENNVFEKVNSDANGLDFEDENSFTLESKPNFSDSAKNTVYLEEENDMFLHSVLEKSNSEIDALDDQSSEYSTLKESTLPKLGDDILEFDKKKKNKLLSELLSNFVELECGRFSCKICGNKIRKYYLKRHLTSHDHSRYKYKCNICQKLFVSDISLSLHSRNYHKELKPFKCEHENCNKSFVDEKSLKVHLRYHYERPYKCPMCPKEFVYNSKLKVHISNHSKNISKNVKSNSSIKEELNHDNETTENSLMNTNSEVHISDNAKTEEFNAKRFKQAQKIKVKKKISRSKEGEKVVCEVCGKSITKHKLYYHLKVHDDSRYSFQCDICKKMFISQKSLRNHIKIIHTKELEFKCSWKDCDKKFVDQSSLKAHINRHVSDRPFKCSACFRGFIYEYKRDYHYKTYHVNGRSFKCDVCNKGFYEQHDLNKHKIIHSNERPYACDQCPAKFLRERCLLWHKKQHSGVKDYICKICGKGYALYNGIYSHMKIHGIKYSKDYEKGLTDDYLIDGEYEKRISYNGITAIETTIGFNSSNSLSLQQISNGKHLMQLIYDSTSELIDCEYIRRSDVVENFLERFYSQYDIMRLRNFTSMINIPKLKSPLISNHEFNRFIEDNIIPDDYYDLQNKIPIDDMFSAGKITYKQINNYNELPDNIKIMVNYHELKKKCNKLNQEMKKIAMDLNSQNEMKKFEATEHFVRRKRSVTNLLIAPNTKWCGRGQMADSYNELGGASRADKCCRKHDYCKGNIPAMTTKWHLFNYRPYTISHCSCDTRFRTCLKMADSADANMVGKIFFNIVQTKCFVLKPEKVCKMRDENDRCIKKALRKRAYLRDNRKF
ncbi:zinc finger protein 287-like [Condylostylus longicornis]|uniref:zinc finger protein 287-like n=1 Tax=Condylostylus longicornis TaxID=2530218 RepID=UPI00244E2B49|nr:zinc finger protein 287-like [Condylostylus longicornis]